MKSGAAQLMDWMERRAFSQRDTANFFGWDETFISKLIRGHRRPGRTNAIKIEQATGIPVEAWESSRLDTSAAPVAAKAPKRKLAKASSR